MSEPRILFQVVEISGVFIGLRHKDEDLSSGRVARILREFAERIEKEYNGKPSTPDKISLN